MTDTGQKFFTAPSSLMGHGPDLEVKVKDLEFKFKTPLFPNLITDLIHLW